MQQQMVSMDKALLVMAKIAETSLGHGQNRTNKQEYHKATFIIRGQVEIKKCRYSPINSYHLFLQSFLLNIVL